MSATLGGLGLPSSSSSSSRPPPVPISGRDYILKLRKYLGANLTRLALPARGKSAAKDASWLAQSYTLLTLGLDPNSAPLSPAVKIPLTLGFGSPSQPQRSKPVLLRLPPDKLLYLLLRWQSLPQALPHVGRTDVPVPDGVATVARGRSGEAAPRAEDGDVLSVRSWVGSIRSVSMGSSRAESTTGFGWWSKPKDIDEDRVLLELYTIFNTLPGLLIHPPFNSEAQVSELLDAGGYTQFGGVDVRVPLDVLRNLQVLELEGCDPRGLLIPVNSLLHSLTVRDVEDADDWLPELVVVGELPPPPSESPVVTPEAATPRFPNLRHLSLPHTSLLSFPALPLTSVTHLDLSNNLLNAIPESLSALHNLVSLNLSSNLITSVRNASAALGNVHTINIARNRIDCLVGLDRIPGLRRVDVRANLLTEAGEVGRLAVLPCVEAVWAAENPFTHTLLPSGAAVATDWRVEIAAAFAAEGRDVVLDDIPFSWAEQRGAEALLASRGMPANSHANHSNSNAAHGRPHDVPAPAPPPRATSPRPPVSPIASPTRASFHLAATSDGTRDPVGSRSRSPRSPRSPSSGKTQQQQRPPRLNVATAVAAPSPFVPSPTTRALAPPQPSPSPTPSPRKAAAAAGKKTKRPKRRVVNLDDDAGAAVAA